MFANQVNDPHVNECKRGGMGRAAGKTARHVSTLNIIAVVCLRVTYFFCVRTWGRAGCAAQRAVHAAASRQAAGERIGHIFSQLLFFLVVNDMVR